MTETANNRFSKWKQSIIGGIVTSFVALIFCYILLNGLWENHIHIPSFARKPLAMISFGFIFPDLFLEEFLGFRGGNIVLIATTISFWFFLGATISRFTRKPIYIASLLVISNIVCYIGFISIMTGLD